ncbi:UPAR/Ly6 domain-containing protein crok-like [Tachypleus tridentatus]|uniref:UPAR/Ly6 domain-containing protein crok-like n=1 Tax=Tachypleus tridentatus TaxID=6853 RepID=UPI003FD02185
MHKGKISVIKHTCCVAAVLFMVVHGGTAIMCWECNSIYDPNCNDPFNNFTMALVDCSQRSLPHYPNTPATLCRKVIQKVNNEYRYIRSCGWLTDEKRESECMKRAGTYHVLIQYCNCKADGCNDAPPIQFSFPTQGVVVVASILSYRMF